MDSRSRQSGVDPEQRRIPGVQTGSSLGTLVPTVARLNLSAGGTRERLLASPKKSRQKGELARLQSTRQGPVAILYWAIATGKEGSAEHLEVGSKELAILYHMQGSL